ncbi:MAG: hypothetical protein VW701_14565, partial [Deltaproteobacteria bacterium]
MVNDSLLHLECNRWITHWGGRPGENLVSGGQKLRQTDRKSEGVHWDRSYILMGLSTVNWLGNDWMRATVVGDGCLTEVFVQISMIWRSLLFGLTVESIELPASI